MRREFRDDKVSEVIKLAAYVQGMADAQHNEQLAKAAQWLEDLSHQMCGQGYIGCTGGRECSSDHK